MKTSPNLIWIDLETTGLKVDKDKILEMAVIVTDGDLSIIDESMDVVIHQSKTVMNRMGKWCRVHHGNSGLTEKSLKSKVTLPEARKKLKVIIEKYCPRKTGILCGSSVHFDRMFIKRYFPLIDKYLSYRMIDVTSIKELAKRWYPKKVVNFLDNKDTTKSHRAFDDIKWSIKELKFYRETIFKNL
jgi:oligoribonuclease